MLLGVLQRASQVDALASPSTQLMQHHPLTLEQEAAQQIAMAAAAESETLWDSGAGQRRYASACTSYPAT